MALHEDEVPVDLTLARRLVDEQFPQWADLPLSAAGDGTDNRMFRLGEELVVRLPRRPGTAADVAKEQTWIPRLGPVLPVDVPEPMALGGPGAGYPFPWSVLRWIEGEEPGPATVRDWAAFGRDLAGVVRALHGDLRSANLLVRDGRLAAVLDFGALSLGRPAAEHAAVWHFPAAMGSAYREALGVDDDTWERARGWALAVSLLAMPYYWSSWPEFAQGGVDKVRRLLAES